MVGLLLLVIDGVFIYYDVIGCFLGYCFGNLKDSKWFVILWLYGGVFIFFVLFIVYYFIVGKFC